MKAESFKAGVFYMLLSATGLSLVALFAKVGIGEFSLTSLLFLRFVVATILCFIFLYVAGELKEIFPIKNLRIHFLRSLFVLTAQYSFIYYLEYSTLLNATLLLNTGPLFIPLIDRWVLKKHVGKSTWVSVAVAFIGVICVLQPDKGILSLVSMIGLLAGLCQGASQVIFGIAAKEERSDISVLYLFVICTCLTFLPYLLIDKLPAGEPIWGDAWYGAPAVVIVFLGIGSCFNQLFRAAAYNHGSPSRLAPFLYISILLSGIFDWTIFGRIPNTLSIIGAVLIVLGGVLKIYLRHKILKGKS